MAHNFTAEPFTIKPHQLHVLSWFSTSDANSDQDPAHIDPADYTAYVAELLALGQSDAAPGGTSTAAAPYSWRLRPLGDIGRLISANRVGLVKIEFYAYDPTFAGAAGQDATTLTAISDSTTTTNDAFAQSRYKNGLLPSFQPNMFRPAVLINGYNVLGSVGRSYYADGGNQGDLSIGLPLPYCLELVAPIDFAQIQRIEIYAPCAQYIEDTSRWQRYAVQCLLTFVELPEEVR